MALAVLLQTSRVSAEATVERLLARDIAAEIIDQPNSIVRLASGGNYRVRVAVPEEQLDAARAEIAAWEAEAAPRVNALARQVQLGLLGASLPAIALGAWFLTQPAQAFWRWALVIGVWLTGLGVWVFWTRARALRTAGFRNES